MNVIRKALLQHEVFEATNFTASYGIENLRSIDAMWSFSKENVLEEIKLLVEEDLLVEKHPNSWGSTFAGKIYRERFIQDQGYRHHSLISQDKDLKELIIALVGSNHQLEIHEKDYYFIQETLPIYLNKLEEENILATLKYLISEDIVSHNNILHRGRIHLTTDGWIHYNTTTIPLLGLTPPQTILIPSENKTDSIFSHLNIEKPYLDNLQYRWEEAHRCEASRSWLSALIMYGSILEALLTNIINNNKTEAEASSKAPKKNGLVKDIKEWNLFNLIEVAADIDCIDKSLAKFSHSLRDTRNLIHPEKQVTERIEPDTHVVAISKQIVLSIIDKMQQ